MSEKLEKLRDDQALAALGGRTIKTIEGLNQGSGWVNIEFEDGSQADFDHRQDCCEHVALADMEGSDASDYEGALVVEAYEESGESKPKPPVPEDRYVDDYSKWTFYRIVTSKGTIVMRWFGTSNGYYGVEVDVTFTPAGYVEEIW